MAKHRKSNGQTEEQVRADGFITLDDWAHLLGVSSGAARGRFNTRFKETEQDMIRYVSIPQNGVSRVFTFVQVCDRSFSLMADVRRIKTYHDKPLPSRDEPQSEQVVSTSEVFAHMRLVWNPYRGELTYYEYPEKVRVI